MPLPTLTLLTKPGCHLCDDARIVVAGVVSEFEGIAVIELSILDDPALAEQYSEEIPVLLIDGAVHNIWRVDADRLRTALRAATAEEASA